MHTNVPNVPNMYQMYQICTKCTKCAKCTNAQGGPAATMYQISGTNGRYIYRINIPEKEAAMDKPSELFSADEDEEK